MRLPLAAYPETMTRFVRRPFAVGALALSGFWLIWQSLLLSVTAQDAPALSRFPTFATVEGVPFDVEDNFLLLLYDDEMVPVAEVLRVDAAGYRSNREALHEIPLPEKYPASYKIRIVNGFGISENDFKVKKGDIGMNRTLKADFKYLRSDFAFRTNFPLRGDALELRSLGGGSEKGDKKPVTIEFATESTSPPVFVSKSKRTLEVGRWQLIGEALSGESVDLELHVFPGVLGTLPQGGSLAISTNDSTIELRRESLFLGELVLKSDIPEASFIVKRPDGMASWRERSRKIEGDPSSPVGSGPFSSGTYLVPPGPYEIDLVSAESEDGEGWDKNVEVEASETVTVSYNQVDRSAALLTVNLQLAPANSAFSSGTLQLWVESSPGNRIADSFWKGDLGSLPSSGGPDTSTHSIELRPKARGGQFPRNLSLVAELTQPGSAGVRASRTIRRSVEDRLVPYIASSVTFEMADFSKGSFAYSAPAEFELGHVWLREHRSGERIDLTVETPAAGQSSNDVFSGDGVPQGRYEVLMLRQGEIDESLAVADPNIAVIEAAGSVEMDSVLDRRVFTKATLQLNVNFAGYVDLGLDGVIRAELLEKGSPKPERRGSWEIPLGRSASQRFEVTEDGDYYLEFHIDAGDKRVLLDSRDVTVPIRGRSLVELEWDAVQHVMRDLYVVTNRPSQSIGISYDAGKAKGVLLNGEQAKKAQTMAALTGTADEWKGEYVDAFVASVIVGKSFDLIDETGTVRVRVEFDEERALAPGGGWRELVVFMPLGKLKINEDFVADFKRGANAFVENHLQLNSPDMADFNEDHFLSRRKRVFFGFKDAFTNDFVSPGGAEAELEVDAKRYRGSYDGGYYIFNVENESRYGRLRFHSDHFDRVEREVDLIGEQRREFEVTRVKQMVGRDEQSFDVELTPGAALRFVRLQGDSWCLRSEVSETAIRELAKIAAQRGESGIADRIDEALSRHDKVRDKLLAYLRSGGRAFSNDIPVGSFSYEDALGFCDLVDDLVNSRFEFQQSNRSSSRRRVLARLPNREDWRVIEERNSDFDDVRGGLWEWLKVDYDNDPSRNVIVGGGEYTYRGGRQDEPEAGSHPRNGYSPNLGFRVVLVADIN